MVKNCKIYQDKGLQGRLPPGDLTKTFAQGARNLTFFRKFARGLPGGW